jgi:hypothetical protein
MCATPLPLKGTAMSPDIIEEEFTPHFCGEYQYLLSKDDAEMNDLKREEFYYDHVSSR